MFRVVIPARYASARLPGKPLRQIGGKPMIQHVYERALSSDAAEVWIATDDVRIATACAGFGARVAMTDANHPSGTDRIAEVAEAQGWADSDLVVNVQGDEPLLPSALIDRVAQLLQANPQAGMATLAVPVRTLEDFLDPNIVKVVADGSGHARYFSRAPIPWNRDGAPHGLGSQSRWDGALRHLGLYAYRTGALKRLAALPPGALEQKERLEQLRALENGITIALAVVEEAPPAGVDTPEDLARVEKLLEHDG